MAVEPKSSEKSSCPFLEKSLLCKAFVSWDPRGHAILGITVRNCAGDVISYEQRLLFDLISTLLHRNPSIRLEHISRETGVSVRQIQKVVSRLTGKRFSDLQQEVLLEEFRNLVASRPTVSIKEVASAMGYKSPRPLARAIRHLCGLSPEELRSQIATDIIMRDATLI